MTDWRHKDEWKKDGNGFLIVISRHTVTPPKGWTTPEGPHRWCVYAYIYPGHPHFAKFSGPEMWQDAATCMPMHGGPSLLRWHYDDNGKPVSVQVGCDYNHLHDDDYTHLGSSGEAWSIFNDADELHQWLTACHAIETEAAT